MADEIKNLANLDRLIHEPSRLVIVAVLSACENADFTYLLHAAGLSKGNLSAHLSKLEEKGYIQITKKFKGKDPSTISAVTPAGRREFNVYRKQYLAFVQHLEQ